VRAAAKRWTFLGDEVGAAQKSLAPYKAGGGVLARDFADDWEGKLGEKGLATEVGPEPEGAADDVGGAKAKELEGEGGEGEACEEWADKEGVEAGGQANGQGLGSLPAGRLGLNLPGPERCAQVPQGGGAEEGEEEEELERHGESRRAEGRSRWAADGLTGSPSLGLAVV
jgi:hypothetical protein